MRLMGYYGIFMGISWEITPSKEESGLSISVNWVQFFSACKWIK
jgi:hypothetical protein